MEEEESEPLPLSITLSITAVRPGAAREGQGSLHVWEAGWQERHGGERVGLTNGVREGERGTGECVCCTICGQAASSKTSLCLYAIYPCAPVCAGNCVCVCVHEHADVYSFLRSNAHSQMKSSNVSAREPQLGSHGS